MNTPRKYLRDLNAGNSSRRTTSELRTPLLIAASLIGLPWALGHFFMADDDGATPVTPPSSPPPTVDANVAYPMNHYLPGAGYYHAPWHAWFPMPFNTYQAGRGWFRGGQWRPTAQEDEAEKRELQRQTQTSGFTSSTGSGARMMTSRPSPAAVQKANSGAAAQHSSNVTRGGFGASSRPGIS